MGGGKIDNIVDQAVDKVAVVAKDKVKEMLGGAGEGDAQKPAAAGGGASGDGGIDALAGMLDDDKKKEGGADYSDLFSAGKDEKTPSSGGGEKSLTDQLGDLASQVTSGGETKAEVSGEQLMSFGKSLFS